MYATEELTAEKLERWVAALEDELDNAQRKHALVSGQVKAGKAEKGAEKRTAELLASVEAELARVRALKAGEAPEAPVKGDEPETVAVEVPDA